MKVNLKNLGGMLVLAVALPALTAMKAEFKKSGNTVIVRNNSSVNIDQIYFSHADKSDWTGKDVLGSHKILAPGEETEIEVGCGIWDVKLVLENKGECFTYGEPVCGDDEVWEIGDLDCIDGE